ncbi:ATP-binding cassette domain-containing protein [Microbacterium terrisoli]|uniref:ATP-binding cassette domain-containing protein n=1 Tax=Microbacterium terrisoli TaxID=3242192 RepID=UPI0028050ED1|nr:ATP-binding cassette domain-containing protein [Microbacterium protaetiae]
MTMPLTQQQDLSQDSTVGAVDDATPRMVLSEITKLYSGVAALTDVSVAICGGEVHALLGENGAGKSTLMNVASGTVQPDGGNIEFEGERVVLTPTAAAKLGIAIVYQHPAVLPDMTVLENLQVSLPASVFTGGTTADIAGRMLDRVGLHVHLRDRVEDLSIAQKHLLEIAKAFAINPKVLILDEPTAPLGEASVEMLFSMVREAVRDGVAVVYITHRLAEVRELAHRVTVLRDGRVRGESTINAVSDDELLAMIVGRQLESTFPPKHVRSDEDLVAFEISGLSTARCADISIRATRGQIIGISGVTGNGQSDLLRALAGLEHFDGQVTLGGVPHTTRDLLHQTAFVPADRHGEGLMMRLNVRENAAVAALRKFRGQWLLSRKKELSRVIESLSSLDVRTPSLDANVAALSGGNQQKIVMSRVLLSEPSLIVADEPTQGVDVGARAEIYRILREVADAGIPVIVSSSDAKELEGLCDTVVVMSRGQIVATLHGDDVTEGRMIAAAVSATTLDTATLSIRAGDERSSSALRRFIQGDFAPSIMLVVVIIALGAVVFSQNDRYLSTFSLGSLLTLATALGFIALGQTIPLMLGGIDLSVGPLAGLLVVVASFFVNADSSLSMIIGGLFLVVVVAAAVGIVNAALIRFAKFTAIAATLATYIALQGMSFVLRDGPGGLINSNVSAAIQSQWGPVPVAFVILVVVAVVAEIALRKTRWGLRLRAAGSDEESARRVGVRVNLVTVGGYVLTSLFTVLGALMLMAQIGIGDPQQGVSYTLASITAVVLGGTSLLGGRGTFIGTLLGAVLLTQVTNATTFLGLPTSMTYFFQGGLILIAAVAYSVIRMRRRRVRRVTVAESGSTAAH